MDAAKVAELSEEVLLLRRELQLREDALSTLQSEFAQQQVSSVQYENNW